MLKQSSLPPELENVKAVAQYLAGESKDVSMNVKSLALINGNRMYQEGNYEEAYNIYKVILEEEPDNVEAKMNIAFALVRLGRNEEALKLFQEIPEEKINEYVFNEMGNIHARMGLLEKAEEYYRRALELNPNFHLARINQSITMLNRGAPERAKELLEGYEVDEEHRGAYHKAMAMIEFALGNLESAVVHISEYLREEERDVDALLFKAECESRLGRFEDAEESAKRAYEIKKSPEVKTALAAIELENGKVDEAIKLAESSLKKGGDVRTLRVLAKGYFLKGDYEKSYEYASKFLEQRESLELRMVRGESARKLGRYEIAKNDADVVLENKPDYPKAMILKALALANLGEFDTAIELLNEAKELDDDFLVYTAYAEVYAIQGNKRKVAEALEGALERKMSVEHLRKLCIILYELKDYERLDKYLKRLTGVTNSDSYIWFLKGEVAYETDLGKAEKYYKLAVELDDKFLDAYLRLAIISAEKENFEEMEKYIEKIITLEAKADVWRTLLSKLIEKERYESVLDIIDKIVEKTSDESLRIYQLEALVKLEKYDEGAKLGEKLHKEYSGEKRIALLLGISYYHLSRFADAVKLLEPLMSISDLEVDASYYMARIYFDTGRPKESLELVEKYEEYPKFMLLKAEILLAMEEYEEVVDYVNHIAMALGGKELTKALIYKMQALFRMNKEEGFEVAEDILRRDPENFETLLLVSMEYEKKGMYEETLKYASRAVEIEKNEEILRIYTLSLFKTNRLEEAMNAANSLLEIAEKPEYIALKAKIMLARNMVTECFRFCTKFSEDKWNDEIRLLLGKAQFKLKNYESSAKYFEEVLSSDLTNYDALYHLSLIYYLLEDYQRAEKMFQLAVGHYRAEVMADSDFVESYADTEIKLGKYDIALQILDGNMGELTEKMNLLYGIASYNMGNYEKALAHLTAVSEDYDDQVIYYKVLTLVALGRFEEANKLFGNAKERKDLLYYHGLVLYNLGKYEGAVEKFEDYIKNEGKIKDVEFYLGVSYFNLSRYEEAVKHLSKAETINDEAYKYEALSYYWLENYENAVRFFDICEKKGFMSGEMWYYYGDSLDKVGKSGFEYYKKAWEFGYKNSKIAYLLLKGHYEKGELEEAEKYINEASSQSLEALLLGAKVLRDLKKYSGALELLRDSSEPEAVIMRAQILIDMGSEEEAKKELLKVAYVPEGAYHLVKLLVGEENYEEALKYLSVAEKHGDVSREKMFIYFGTGDWENAVQNAKTLVDRGEQVNDALRILGLSLFELGRYEEAIEHLEKCKSMGMDVDKELGLSYYKVGNYQKAIQYLSSLNAPIFELGMSYYNMGEYEKALEILENAEDEKSREYAGLSAFKLGNYEKAVEYLDGMEGHEEELAMAHYMLGNYRKVVEIQPADKKILAMSYYNLGEFQKALEEFEGLEKKDGEDYYHMAIANLRLGKYEDAEYYFDLAQKSGYEGDIGAFKGIIAYSKGDYSTAATLLKNSKDRETEKMYAISLYHIGDLRGAVKHLKDLDDEESKKYYALALMALGGERELREARDIFLQIKDNKNAAKCSMLLGDYEDALKLLSTFGDEESIAIKFEALIRLGREEDAKELYPKLSEEEKEKYAKDMVRIYISNGEYKEAKNLIEKYFQEDFDWFLLRSKLHIAEGNYKAAMDDLTHAKRINPKSKEISKYLAPIYLNMGEVDKALKEAKKSVKDFPEDALCWYNLGVAYQRKDNLKKAIEALKKAVDIDDGMWDAWRLIGMIQIKEHDFENAYASLLKVDKKIENRDIKFLLAVSAYELEKHEEALKYIDEALTMRRDPIGLYYKALILSDMGRKDEAISILNEALRLKPDFVDARKLLGSLMGGE